MLLLDRLVTLHSAYVSCKMPQIGQLAHLQTLRGAAIHKHGNPPVVP